MFYLIYLSDPRTAEDNDARLQDTFLKPCSLWYSKCKLKRQLILLDNDDKKPRVNSIFQASTMLTLKLPWGCLNLLPQNKLKWSSSVKSNIINI